MKFSSTFAALWTVACLAGGPVHGEAEVPAAILDRLGSDKFEERETAQRMLREWADKEAGENLLPLLDLSLKHEAAEVRLRALGVLRGKVAEIYDSEGQGYLGIRMDSRLMKVPGKGDGPSPVVVITEVVADTAADRAGIRVGDCIVRIAGKEIAEITKDQPPTEALRQCVEQLKPTSTIEVGILRNGEIKTFAVTLGRRPAALEEMAFDTNLERIREVEDRLKEEHFRKWLLENKDRR